MIVVDACVVANLVGDDGAGGRAARDAARAARELSAPDLVDVETVSVLRKRWLAGAMDDDRLRAALDDLATLPITRYPSAPLMRRAYELRANVTPYDAAYVALAEGLACALLTADKRLSKAPGPACPIEVLRAA